MGDITKLDVEPGSGYVIHKSGCLASVEDVDLDVKWEGFSKGLFGQGLFMVKVSGRGDLFVNTFGVIDHHKRGPGEEMVVDNFHLVAFSDYATIELRSSEDGRRRF